MQTIEPIASVIEGMHIDRSPGATSDRYDDVSTDIVDPSAELLQLADDIEQFLLQQVDRAEQILSQCHRLVSSDDVARELRQQLEQERVSFQRKREQEEQRIAEISQRLTDAFLRLEAEQCRIEGQQESLRARTQPASQGQGNGPMNPFSEPASVLPTVAPLELTIRQFQQLRREIDKHAGHAP